jgi:hypothetical protein
MMMMIIMTAIIEFSKCLVTCRPKSTIGTNATLKTIKIQENQNKTKQHIRVVLYIYKTQ